MGSSRSISTSQPGAGLPSTVSAPCTWTVGAAPSVGMARSAGAPLISVSQPAAIAIRKQALPKWKQGRARIITSGDRDDIAGRLFPSAALDRVRRDRFGGEGGGERRDPGG